MFLFAFPLITCLEPKCKSAQRKTKTRPESTASQTLRTKTLNRKSHLMHQHITNSYTFTTLLTSNQIPPHSHQTVTREAKPSTKSHPLTASTIIPPKLKQHFCSGSNTLVLQSWTSIRRSDSKNLQNG